MAIVSPVQFRLVTQYRDSAGHQLPTTETGWYDYEGFMTADCPKCSTPEPLKVACGHPWHTTGAAPQNWGYCPLCGAMLKTREE